MSDGSQNGGPKNEQMSFLGHLEELRWRLVRSAIAIIIVAVVLFIFTEPIVKVVYMNMMKTDFPTYHFLCNLGHWIGMGDGTLTCLAPFVTQHGGHPICPGFAQTLLQCYT